MSLLLLLDDGQGLAERDATFSRDIGGLGLAAAAGSAGAGTYSLTLDGLSLSASGMAAGAGTFARALGAAGMSGAGAARIAATAALIVGAIGLSVVGAGPVSASAAISVGAFGLSATGAGVEPEPIDATFARSLLAFGLGATSTATPAAAASAQIGEVSPSASAEVRIAAASDLTLGGFGTTSAAASQAFGEYSHALGPVVLSAFAGGDAPAPSPPATDTGRLVDILGDMIRAAGGDPFTMRRKDMFAFVANDVSGRTDITSQRMTTAQMVEVIHNALATSPLSRKRASVGEMLAGIHNAFHDAHVSPLTIPARRLWVLAFRAIRDR